MNEIIAKLTQQCYEYNETMQGTWFNKTKFAELIIRECAGICDERARSAPIGSEEQCEADDCSYSIKKHFGVD